VKEASDETLTKLFMFHGHSDPFACHSGRSEESDPKGHSEQSEESLPFAQGKLREESDPKSHSGHKGHKMLIVKFVILCY